MFGNGKVFVSHTHEDNAACAPVLTALDAWQVDYWFDTAQLSAGLELLDNIQRGLAGRDIYLRICTPAANASPWMAEEQKLARTLQAPNRSQRLMIDLILKPGYVVSAEEAGDMVIDATQQPQVEWLQKLREALNVPSRERHISRRAVLGVGITSLAALGGLGFAGKLLFFTPPSPNLYLPIGHQPTATPLAGASRVRWTFSLYPQPFGSATSVFQAGQTLICSDASTLTALNSADGKFLWIQRQYSINRDVPPTVVGDAIYVTYDDTTYASENAPGVHNIYLAVFNVADGSERWHQLIIADPGEKTDTSAVTVAGNTAYVRYNQTLYACDAKTGRTLWSQGAGEAGAKLGEILPAPSASGDNVFAILGDRKLHAFAASTGAPLWPAPFASTMPIRTRPGVANGLVYVGADGGWCYALDAVTGAVRWKTDLLGNTTSPIDAATKARFTSLGLTLSENVLYISGGWPVDTGALNPSDVRHEGVIQALDPATGKILWQSAPREQMGLSGTLNTQDSLFRAAPLVVGDSVFVATRMQMPTINGRDIDFLFALNKLDGKIKWNFQMWGYPSSFSDYDGVPSAPMVSGDTLYIISGNEMLYAISHAD
jgi:outer membrane protein assembly factor BamB